MKKIAIGVLGSQSQGPAFAERLRMIAGCSVSVVSDAGVRQITSLCPSDAVAAARRLLKRVDAVVIATPVPTRFVVAKACLLAGRHALLDVPIATTAVECATLARIAEQRHLVLMAGYSRLYSGALAKMKQIVDNGDIGTLHYLATRRLELDENTRGAGLILSLTIQDIAIALHLFQEVPVSVRWEGLSCLSADTEDVAVFWLRFSGERAAIIQSSWREPRQVAEVRLVGSKRMIVYDELRPDEKIKVFDVRVGRPLRPDAFAAFDYTYHYGDTYSPYMPDDDPAMAVCRGFVKAIEVGSVPLVGGAFDGKVVRVLEMAGACRRRDPDQTVPSAAKRGR